MMQAASEAGDNKRRRQIVVAKKTAAALVLLVVLLVENELRKSFGVTRQYLSTNENIHSMNVQVLLVAPILRTTTLCCRGTPREPSSC